MDGEHRILRLSIAVNKISINEYRFTFTNESKYELEITQSQLAFSSSMGYWSLILIDAVTMHSYPKWFCMEHWLSKELIIRPDMSVENTLTVSQEFSDYDPASNDHPHILFWAMHHKDFYSLPCSGVIIIKD